MTYDPKEKTRQAFADRFRCALAEIGVAPGEQKRLQQLFGISGQAVRKWTEGLAMPTPSRMPHVAAVLGVRRAWLQDGEGPMRPTVGVAEDGPQWEQGVTLSGAEVRLLTLYRLLRPEQREALEVIVQSLAEAAKARNGE